MLTQIIEGDIMLSKLDDIVMRTGETNRIIIFRLWDGKGEAITSEDYSMEFVLQKPDGNFVIQTLGSITDGFYLHTTEQMSVVCGRGYYTLRISDNDDLIYTAHGGVIIDDNTLNDSDIESISEVNGLRFPDDFLTTDSPVALIDDGIPALDKVWSSDKTYNYVISEVGAMIDDGSIVDNKTWSSYKIAYEISESSGSSSDDYTTTEQEIGTWLGTPLFRRVVEISGNKSPGTYHTLFTDNTINLIKYDGIVYNQYWTGTGCMLNSYYNSSNYCGCAYNANDGARIDWYNNLNMTVNKIYLIIYYTKK